MNGSGGNRTGTVSCRAVGSILMEHRVAKPWESGGPEVRHRVSGLLGGTGAEGRLGTPVSPALPFPSEAGGTQCCTEATGDAAGAMVPCADALKGWEKMVVFYSC